MPEVARPPPLNLGAFLLDEKVAHGGMGHVWRGRHAVLGLPVAIKVVRPDLAGASVRRAALRDEIRVVAALDHPSIVTIHDSGEIDASVASRSEGRLEADSPYLVLEWAPGGTLAQAGPPRTWTRLRAILEGVLGGLAHAHSRGVLHRDLKPQNVLLGEGGRPILSDFGIARFRGVADDERLVGTPRYMAPEQFARHGWDLSPPTDLYALGCLANWLVLDRPPFDDSDASNLSRRHRFEPPPPLPDAPWLPERFDEWVATLLAKHPRDRFQTAADALEALRSLPDPAQDEAWPDRLAPPPEAATVDLLTMDEPAPPPTPQPLPRAHTGVWPAPSVAADWRAGEARLRRPEAEALRRLGAGVALFGLRPLPLVGRPRERDRLWAALAQVHQTRRVRAVWVHGPSGVGASRLARWLAERAAEDGLATVLSASHGPEEPRAIGAMLARHLRCAGGSWPERLATARAHLRDRDVHDPDEAWLLAAALAEDGRTTRQERVATVVRLLAREATGRPVVLLLEDVQWGDEALELVGRLLDPRAEPIAALVVLVSRDEELAERRGERSRLLRMASRLDPIALAPLPRPDHSRLVRQLLQLPADIAARVEARTAGNPQFAVQLVGAWLESGRLRFGRDGFSLAPGDDGAIAPDLLATAAARLDRIALADEGVALERAALLGSEIHDPDWAVACADLRVDLPTLRERLLRGGIAAPVEGGWRFTSPVWPEVLERRAREAGRLVDHCRACAEALSRRDDETASLRRGRHLLEAGLLDEAVELLLGWCRERARLGAWSRLGDGMPLLETALQRLDPPPGDVRTGELAAIQAMWRSREAPLQEAMALLGRAIDDASAHGWPELELRLRLRRADALGSFGEEVGIEADVNRALALAGELGDARAEATCWLRIARLRLLVGDRQGATAAADRSDDAWSRAGDPPDRAGLWLIRAGLASNAGRHAEAERWLRRAVELAGSARLGAIHQHALGQLADTLRHTGRLEEATELYRAHLREVQRSGDFDALFPRLNLAIVLAEQSRYDEARRALEAIAAELEDREILYGQPGVQAWLAAAAASRGDESAFERHLGRAAALTRARAASDPDDARALEVAGREAWRRGWSARAADALGRGAAVWDTIGDAESAEQARRAQRDAARSAPAPA